MWWYALAVLLTGVITLLLAWPGLKTDYSAWQLKQKQSQTRSTRAKLDLERLIAKPSLLTLQVIFLVFLFVCLFAVLTQVQTVWQALGTSFGLFLLTNLLAKIKPIGKITQKIYLKIERYLLVLAWVQRKLGKVLAINSFKNAAGSAASQVESIDELMFLIENSPSVVDDRSRHLIKSALEFEKSTIETVMTPWVEIVSLASDDLLGPLALDELHRTGADYFPVLAANDKLIGILPLAEVTNLDNKTSRTAKELCDHNYSTLKLDDNLTSALSQLILQQKTVAVVLARTKPVGLVKLSEIINRLIGGKM